MRRSLLGLLMVVATASLLVGAGCQRSGTLCVVSINRGNSLRSDIADFYFEPVDSVFVYQFMPDSVEVQLKYLEVGAGLPTWTPYEALIEKAGITYKGTNTEREPYTPATVQVEQTVIADPTGKTVTKFYMTTVSGTFKEANFEYDVLEPPDYDIVDNVSATITFSGYDSVANRAVSAKGTLQIEFGNFWDDPGRFGR